uniref:Uncharacterized protein n=1 Tax=Rhizophora mucronata TaxID=61149 RepID=A0A2P2NSP7_RHIMU
MGPGASSSALEGLHYWDFHQYINIS